MAGELLHAYLIVSGVRGYYLHFSTYTSYHCVNCRILFNPLASFLLPPRSSTGWTVARHRRDAPAKGVCVVVGRVRWATFAANVRQELQRIIAYTCSALSHGGVIINYREYPQTSRCCRHDKPSSREMIELLARHLSRTHAALPAAQPPPVMAQVPPRPMAIPALLTRRLDALSLLCAPSLLFVMSSVLASLMPP
jgi:hypothetical protein